MSELANWNGHLDPIPQRALRQPTSSPNASNLSLESYHPPVDHQEYDVIEQPSLLDEFLEDKRTEESVVVHGEREPSINLFPDVQLHDLVDTSSVSSDNVYSPYDQPSVPRTPENSGMQLLQLSAYSKPALFHLPHNSSVNIFRVQEVGASPSSREDSALSETADFMCRNEPEIIDLTGNEDNEDEELTVDEMLTDGDVYVSDDHLESRSSHQRSPAPRSPPRSSPIGQHESLFTPPPISKRRRRMMMAHIAVPSFPKGFSKADYQPMSEAFLAPFHEAPITRGVEHLSIADALGAAFNQNRASPSPPVSLEKHKGKESERVVPSSVPARKKYKPRALISFGAGIDTAPSALLDTHYTHTVLQLGDVDVEPPLTRTDLATNTRFAFALAWRKRTLALQKGEVEWVHRFKLGGREWSADEFPFASLRPATSDTGGKERRKWELVPPTGPPQTGNKRRATKAAAESTDLKKHLSVNDFHTDHTDTSIDVPDVRAPSPEPVYDQQASAAPPRAGDGRGADMDVDMNAYFNGLGDSPNKSFAPPRHDVVPVQPFRPPLMQFAGPSQLNGHRPSFAPLAIDPVLAQIDGECFLGMPPSPGPAQMETSPLQTPLLVSPSPFQPEDHCLGMDSGSPTRTTAWSLIDTGDLPQDDVSPVLSPPDNITSTITFNTIDPSLLGGEQAQETPIQPATPKAQKPRPKLPEPVIYVRRPIDSSSLPFASGSKRSVQIKFRERDLPPLSDDEDDVPLSEFLLKRRGKTDTKEDTPSPTQVQNDAGLSASVAEEDNTTSSSRRKRHSVPSSEIRQSRKSAARVVSDTDSSFVLSRASEPLSINDAPSEAGKPKLNLRLGVTRDVRNSPAKDAAKAVAPEKTYCHQCRNATTRLKMQCSNVLGDRVCAKRFCQRCILNRYPDITFDQHSASFMCPSCTDNCNCSYCTRKRGEEFVSMRGGGFAGSRIQTQLTLVRDQPEPVRRAGSTGSANTMPTPDPSASTTPMFWAHVYGMEGERVGRAFIPPQYSASLSLANTQAKSLPAQRHKPEKQKPPRVFIGRPLKSWKIRSVRDLEPAPDDAASFASKGINGKGKGKAVDGRPLRVFIGNPAALHEPHERMPRTPSPSSSRSSSPGLDSDGSLTPLSDLEEDNWPQPDVGECCSWEPPPPPSIERSVSTALSDEQVARAISVALAAIV